MTDDVAAREEPREEVVSKQPWSTPEVVTFLPTVQTKGISYNPTDGIANLTA